MIVWTTRRRAAVSTGVPHHRYRSERVRRRNARSPSRPRREAAARRAAAAAPTAAAPPAAGRRHTRTRRNLRRAAHTSSSAAARSTPADGAATKDELNQTPHQLLKAKMPQTRLSTNAPTCTIEAFSRYPYAAFGVPVRALPKLSSHFFAISAACTVAFEE
eukprot:2230555-Pleurochrysis_carterae.AAC.8